MISKNVEKEASEGILKSPLGDKLTEPIFIPSGIQERLNCCVKNLFINTFNHFLIVSVSYLSLNTYLEIKYIFSTEKL